MIPNACTKHASCVAFAGASVLIIGKSGTGKSSLALQLMALGCQLVADDKTNIRSVDGQLLASCPKAIQGQIEARGIGILAAEPTPNAILRLVVNMEQTETARLPVPMTIQICGVELPLLHVSVQTHFPAAILQYLKGGRIA